MPSTCKTCMAEGTETTFETAEEFNEHMDTHAAGIVGDPTTIKKARKPRGTATRRNLTRTSPRVPKRKK